MHASPVRAPCCLLPNVMRWRDATRRSVKTLTTNPYTHDTAKGHSSRTAAPPAAEPAAATVVARYWDAATVKLRNLGDGEMLPEPELPATGLRMNGERMWSCEPSHTVRNVIFLACSVLGPSGSCSSAEWTAPLGYQEELCCSHAEWILEEEKEEHRDTKEAVFRLWVSIKLATPLFVQLGGRRRRRSRTSPTPVSINLKH